MTAHPKVSMVIPCYNKVAWIGGMFDSILAQRWNNIELVLVNDGSTDGTREIIEEYLPKFRERGFDTVVIDQENQGVGAAVLNGLQSITGDYVCQVDADDELDPDYVGTMAECLRDHKEYDWVVCDMLHVYKDKGVYPQSYFHMPEEIVRENHAEGFLLSRITLGVPAHMIRTEYLRGSELTGNFYHEVTVTQEPQVILPLLLAGGRLKHLSKPLYRRINEASSTAILRNDSFEKAASFHVQYATLAKKVIESLEIEPAMMRRFFALADITMFKGILNVAVLHNSFDCIDKYKVGGNLGWIELVNSLFTPSPNLSSMGFRHQQLLYTAVADNVMHFNPQQPERIKGRVIGWGLGVRSSRFLPWLKGTDLEPTELWDIAGDGINVKKPEPDSLTRDDMVLIFPTRHIADEIHSRINESGCSFMLSDDLEHYLAELNFPGFYDGSIAFAP